MAKEKIEKSKKVKDKKKVDTKKVVKENVKKEGIFKRIRNWFKSVKQETEKVSWPNKKAMIKYSIATIVFIIFFSLLFYVVEIAMAFFKSFV